MIFHENRLPADDSQEISYLILFRNLRQMLQKLSSAAVGALRVNNSCSIQHFLTYFVASLKQMQLEISAD